MPTKRQVIIAEPYRMTNLNSSFGMSAMGSFGDASYMLLSQHNFPLEFDPEQDYLMNADSDRISMWDCDKGTRCWEDALDYLGTRGGLQMKLPSMSGEVLLEFLKIALNARQIYPEVEWTGGRVMGSVHQGNGYPVYHLELFANRSGTEVYSGPMSQNVDPEGGRCQLLQA